MQNLSQRAVRFLSTKIYVSSLEKNCRANVVLIVLAVNEMYCHFVRNVMGLMCNCSCCLYTQKNTEDANKTLGQFFCVYHRNPSLTFSYEIFAASCTTLIRLFKLFHSSQSTLVVHLKTFTAVNRRVHKHQQCVLNVQTASALCSEGTNSISTVL